MNSRAWLAEFIGTFAYVFIGAGTMALGVGGLVGIALAHGLVLLTFGYAYGPISGAHLNPAVTFALWAGQRINIIDALGYIAVQILGAIVAGFALNFLIGSNAAEQGATRLTEGVTPLQGFGLEIILTFLLVNAILHTTRWVETRHFAPLAIGLTLTLATLLGWPLTGASLNPARTLGPAFASGNFADLWLYLAGPVTGGIVAVALYPTLLRAEE